MIIKILKIKKKKEKKKERKEKIQIYSRGIIRKISWKPLRFEQRPRGSAQYIA